MLRASITKTCVYNCDPLKLHFYKVKLGFTGVYIIFLISAKNIDCGYSLEPPRRGCSNEYPQSMFWAELWKISEILSEKFQFLVVKFSIYLNRRVFVMRKYVNQSLRKSQIQNIRLTSTVSEDIQFLKGSIFLKNRHFFIQERFNKLI